MEPKQLIYIQAGQNIRKARENAGMKQETLAAQVGLSRTSITNIEKGRQSLLVHTLYDLATALGVDIDCLLPHIDNPQPQNSREYFEGKMPPDLSEDDRDWILRALNAE